MNKGAFESGVTLVEVMVSIGLMSIILGVLLVSSLSIQRAIYASEAFASNYGAQRRIIDYLARDLRRSLDVTYTTAAGAEAALSSTPVLLENGVALIVSVPGYYESDATTDPTYSQPLPVVETSAGVDYGHSTPEPPTAVTFRKRYVAAEKCVCFVREEGGASEVIVRDADLLSVQVALTPNGRVGHLEVWFAAPSARSSALISTSDEVMLRNTPLDFSP